MAFRGGHHGLWHHWHYTGSNNGSKSGLLITTYLVHMFTKGWGKSIFWVKIYQMVTR